MAEMSFACHFLVTFRFYNGIKIRLKQVAKHCRKDVENDDEK